MITLSQSGVLGEVKSDLKYQIMHDQGLTPQDQAQMLLDLDVADSELRARDAGDGAWQIINAWHRIHPIKIRWREIYDIFVKRGITFNEVKN